MNQREKLKAQLDLIQEMKNQFPKDVFIPQGEDYASVQMERNIEKWHMGFNGHIITYPLELS